MLDIRWNRIMLREFESLACLTEEEQAVLQDWANGKSIVATAMARHMGESKVKEIRRSIREKYDDVSIYSPLLPERIK